MSYTHLTEQERVCIFHQQMAEFRKAQIGRRLTRHRATIGRELKRFRKHPSWPFYRQYFPDSADCLARERRARPRGFRWTAHRPLLAYVLRNLRQEWSPQQITGRIIRDFPHDLKMRVSHQSIYQYIKADRQAGGSLWKRLRQSHKLRRKPYGSGPRRCRIIDRVGIEQRPKEAELRRRIGHWEADTMLGNNKGRLATCVERKSRYVLIARPARRQGHRVQRRGDPLLQKDSPALAKNPDHRQRQRVHRTQATWRTPRLQDLLRKSVFKLGGGTNENTNGLIRQYFPKQTDLSTLSYQRIARIASKLNNRPRKCLAYRTPAEVLGQVLRF